MQCILSEKGDRQHLLRAKLKLAKYTTKLAKYKQLCVVTVS